MEVDVPRQASLISQRRYELVAQIVLQVRRVVMDTGRGQSSGENLNVNGAGCGQPIRPKCCYRVGICWKAFKVVHTRGKGINNAWIGGCRRWNDESRAYRQPRIIDDVGRNSDLFAIIV